MRLSIQTKLSEHSHVLCRLIGGLAMKSDLMERYEFSVDSALCGLGLLVVTNAR